MCSNERWHFQWPWWTPNPVFKVMAFLKSKTGKIPNIWNGTMFGDLDWPLSASCGFVSISWASCFIFSFVLLLWSLSPSGALSSNVATMIVSHITCAVVMYGHCLRQVHSFSEGSEWVMYLNWILFLKLHKLVHSNSRQKKKSRVPIFEGTLDRSVLIRHWLLLSTSGVPVSPSTR